MDRQDRVFGIPEMDRELSTLLPAGWVALLLSSEGAGAQLFAKQFAVQGVGSTPVLYYSTYERTSEVERVFRDMGADSGAIKIVNLAEEYYDRVLAQNLEVSRARERGLTVADLKAASRGPVAVPAFNLSSRLLGGLAQIDAPFRLVLDSLDFLLEILEPPEVVNVARQITYRTQSLGGQALLVVHSNIHAPRMVGLLEDMADVVIELRSQLKGKGIHHSLILDKLRNHPEQMGEFSLALGDRGFTSLEAEK